MSTIHKSVNSINGCTTETILVRRDRKEQIDADGEETFSPAYLFRIVVVNGDDRCTEMVEDGDGEGYDDFPVEGKKSVSVEVYNQYTLCWNKLMDAEDFRQEDVERWIAEDRVVDGVGELVERLFGFQMTDKQVVKEE